MFVALIAVRTAFVSLENVAAALVGPETFVISCPAMRAALNTVSVKTEHVCVRRDGTVAIVRCVSKLFSYRNISFEIRKKILRAIERRYIYEIYEHAKVGGIYNKCHLEGPI